MGAWGSKAFQNDSAVNWLNQLRARGIDVLRRTLTSVDQTNELHELDVDDGASAIAAAEVVAAAFGFFGRDRLPPEARAWLNANQRAFVATDLTLAKRAVQRVVAPNSELSALWHDGSAHNPWQAEVNALISFFEQRANIQTNGIPTSTLRSSAPPRRVVGEREKQIIVTFLEARGLRFTAEQRQRLATSENLEEILRWLGRAVTASSVAAVFDE
jgi:hypothetical protein